MTRPYPDFERETPSPQPVGNDGDYAGMTQYRIRQEFRDLIRELGGDMAGITVGQIIADELRRARS